MDPVEDGQTIKVVDVAMNCSDVGVNRDQRLIIIYHESVDNVRVDHVSLKTQHETQWAKLKLTVGGKPKQ